MPPPGVYYCANAVGRLVGTLASGALYSYVGDTIVDGFGTCLLVSVGFCLLSSGLNIFLHEDRPEARWLPAWLRAKATHVAAEEQQQQPAALQDSSSDGKAQPTI